MVERDTVDFHYETARHMLPLGEVGCEDGAHRRELNLDLGAAGSTWHPRWLRGYLPDEGQECGELQRGPALGIKSMQCFQGTTKSQYEQDVWDQARSDLSADLSAILVPLCS